jgi:altronate dehydratase
MEDGITTLEETSPCTVQRAGTVTVADVPDHGERDIAIRKRGVTR